MNYLFLNSIPDAIFPKIAHVEVSLLTEEQARHLLDVLGDGSKVIVRNDNERAIAEVLFGNKYEIIEFAANKKLVDGDTMTVVTIDGGGDADGAVRVVRYSLWTAEFAFDM